MKKILFLSIVFLGACVLWGNQSTLEKLIKDNEGIDVKVVELVPTGIKGLQIVALEQSNGLRVPVLASDDGKTIIGVSELLISDDPHFKDALQKVYASTQKHNKTITDQKVLKIFKTYNKSNVLSLAGKNSAKTTYMVLDPNCPYCHQEVQKLDMILQNSNVEILVVGALGMQSATKAASFYAALGSKKSQKDKIALLKSIFEKSYQPDEKIDISKIVEIGRELAQAGVNGVPYIIEK
ncbi:hypothetical protein BKH46_08175 [Helicobacter sp. 12S02634-8]|uniref:hypothetical protein n=1 Tax=Helicobacter sp. 12S02634-8 TaxID=1476199 RepID=UPI000BA4ED34|nr:hypothetical protein [Helicobacter sp. 12S02634-8]PAF46278.1 hypothetical protein BKH46_08175 [Helicobacter sp. 12S02634-8]